MWVVAVEHLRADAGTSRAAGRHLAADHAHDDRADRHLAHRHGRVEHAAVVALPAQGSPGTLLGVSEEAVSLGEEAASVATVAALPNQAPAKGLAVADSDSDGEGVDAEDEVSATPPLQAKPATPVTVAHFVAGMQEAFDRARLRARLLTLFGKAPAAQALRAVEHPAGALGPGDRHRGRPRADHGRRAGPDRCGHGLPGRRRTPDARRRPTLRRAALRRARA